MSTGEEQNDGPGDRPLADHVCLALVAEGPTHGWSLVKDLAEGGPIGRIWSLSRPLTYRSIERLVSQGLVDRVQVGRRANLQVTPLGRDVAAAWLLTPVDHLRDLRTEFLLKIALCERAGVGTVPLIDRQRARLRPAIEALTSGAAGDAVGVWRQESAIAADRFLRRLASP